jgi:fermentation-respiration switch protein FrsA (DUF1100 family)
MKKPNSPSWPFMETLETSPTAPPSTNFSTTRPETYLRLKYRGYGHSEGKPGEGGIYRDAAAAYQYLVNVKHIDPATVNPAKAASIAMPLRLINTS